MKARWLLLLGMAVTAAPAAAQTVDSLAIGRKVTDWFYRAQTDSLWAYLSDTADFESRQAFDSGLHEQLATVITRAGFEEELLSEEFVKRNGKYQYWRTAKFSDMAEPLMIRWVLVNGKIAGMGLNPASQAPARDPE